MTRIEICGGIAAGKTTLARLLAGSSSVCVEEQFRDNPFWARFYADPDTWVEEKNFCFLVQHTAGIKAAAAATLVVCDYAVFQDLAYASLANKDGHAAMMCALHDHLYAALPAPTLVVHLNCAPSVQLQRIRARGRSEEAGITVEYLATLNRAIESMLERIDVSVHRIASDAVDFARDADTAAAVRNEVLARVARASAT
jgi:deoxyadenosine/deoxycytidine kinase